METKENKKIKNLISIIILLCGLFAGSLFVDTIQFIKGSGFSERSLSQKDIFESNGKTWIAYPDPVVNLKVINDESCSNCDPSEALVWMRRVIPTVNAQKVNFDSKEGKNLIQNFTVKTIPAFIFDDSVTKTDFYAQAKELFAQKDSDYLLNVQELGLAPGKYLDSPTTEENDATIGNKDSKVKVFVFSDFQCPYCGKFYTEVLKNVISQYKDRVLFDYKHLPLTLHAQANNAALASECALEQGKFWEYANKLYDSQTDWNKTEGTQKFKDYGKMLGLNSTQFNKCLDDKKYQNKIDADQKEADSFGIAGTPAIFINSQFNNGVISLDEMKKQIEAELNK